MVFKVKDLNKEEDKEFFRWLDYRKDFYNKKYGKHISWKGNFTWRDMAFLMLGWIIGTAWMLVWLLALGRGMI